MGHGGVERSHAILCELGARHSDQYHVLQGGPPSAAMPWARGHRVRLYHGLGATTQVYTMRPQAVGAVHQIRAIGVGLYRDRHLALCMLQLQ